MGLDWGPLNRPKPGFEKEVEELTERLETLSERARKPIDERLDQISISPFETLGAPRVGKDAVADDWALEKYPHRKRRWWSEARFLRAFKGYYVLTLAPPCDGMPRYTNGGEESYIEAFSFRAEFLRDCEDILEGEFFEAFIDRTAEELVVYGKRLIEQATKFAHDSDIDIDRLEADDLDGDRLRLDIVLSAGRWCVYWGERGHALTAWY